MDFALDSALQLTGSHYGYIYHYHADSQQFVLNTWSKEVMPACLAANPLKRGYPTGHVELSRFMTLPIYQLGPEHDDALRQAFQVRQF